VAAVSTGDDRRPRKTKLLPVEGFRRKEVERPIGERSSSTRRTVTDGPSRRTAAAEAGLRHAAMVSGSGTRAATWPPFRRVDTTLGDVTAAIVGTDRRVSPEHAGRYPALRLALQPAFPARQPDPAPGAQRRPDRPAALRQPRRRLTFRATQEPLYSCFRLVLAEHGTNIERRDNRELRAHYPKIEALVVVGSWSAPARPWAARGALRGPFQAADPPLKAEG
jgi:hypothetical protein